MKTIKFNPTEKSKEFSMTLRNRVNSYFKDNNISPTGDWRLYTKTFCGFALFVVSYIWLVLFPPESGWGIFALCFLNGASLAYIGFNVAHDAAHGSYSKHTKLNNVLAYSFNFMGADSFKWKIQHNMLHHFGTNIEGYDEDPDSQPLLKMSPNQEHKWWYKFQAFYAIIFYPLIYVVWVTIKDFIKYEKIDPEKPFIPKMKTSDRYIFIFSKIWWVALYIVIPCIVFGWIGLLYSLVYICGICGLILTLVFQPAHVVGKTQFPIPDENGVINMSREEHQLATTCDFAVRDPVTTWLLGGLNFQVEHHLFPYISHIHYPEIHKILKQTCSEFGIQINEYKTFFGAIFAHFYFLNELGKNKN